MERFGVLALLVAGLIVFGWRALPAPLADDAFITFRYAENWAAGHGVVFQPGERLEGYSNFLFLALLALGARLGATPIAAAHWINVAAALAVAWLIVVVLPGRLRRSPARWVAAALWLGSVHTQLNVTSGLETPLTAALALALALAVEHRRPVAAPLAALALALARPEGIVFAGVAMVAALAIDRLEGRPARQVAIGWSTLLVAPYAAYFAWRVIYFGQLLPNSIVAKSGQPLRVAVRRSLDYLVPALATYWPLLALVVAGGVAVVWRFRSRREVPSAPWATWALCAAILGPTVITGSGDPYKTLLRYVLPALPLLLVLGVDAAERLRRLPESKRARLAVAVAVVGLAAIQAGLAVRLPPDRSLDRAAIGLDWLFDPPAEPPEPRGGLSALYTAAAWMTEHLDPDGVVATAEVGIVPYYTGLRVIDTFGLVDRHIAHRPGRPGAKGDPNYVFGLDPDYFVFKKANHCLCGGIAADTELFRDPRFRRRYDLVHVVPDGLRTILVFARREDRPSTVVLDVCADFDAERPRHGGRRVIRRRFDVVGEHRFWLRFYDELQPVVRGDAPVDASAAEAMRAWIDRFACTLTQRPAAAGSAPVVTRRVTVPEHAVLRLAYGVTRARPGASSPVDFRVEADPTDGGATVPLVEDRLVPSDEPIWQDAAVHLGDFAGREIALRFHAERSAVESEGVLSPLRTARWRDPRVVVEPPRADPAPPPTSSDREMP